MKVLMMVTWYGTYGADTMEAGLFHYEQSLIMKEFCETAIFFPFDQTIENKFNKEVENDVLTYRLRMTNSGIRNWKNIVDAFRRIDKEFAPDIIHAHVGLGSGKIAVFLGKLFNKKVVITEHSPIEMMGLENKKNRLLLNAIYGLSSANICVSNNQAERLRDFFPKRDFQVIYNGVITDEFEDKAEVNYAKKDKINVAIVAMFYNKDVKGYQFLLPALAELQREGEPVFLHICGSGEYMQMYQQMAKELGIEDIVRFYGNCPKKLVYEIINQMDYVVSTSLYESAGVSVEEAMLLGKPLLVTRSGGASSLVTEETAIIIEPGSVDEIVRGMKEMHLSLKKFDKDAIRKYAYENFEIKNVCKKHIALYEKRV